MSRTSIYNLTRIRGKRFARKRVIKQDIRVNECVHASTVFRVSFLVENPAHFFVVGDGPISRPDAPI